MGKSYIFHYKIGDKNHFMGVSAKNKNHGVKIARQLGLVGDVIGHFCEGNCDVCGSYGKKLLDHGGKDICQNCVNQPIK